MLEVYQRKNPIILVASFPHIKHLMGALEQWVWGLSFVYLKSKGRCRSTLALGAGIQIR